MNKQSVLSSLLKNKFNSKGFYFVFIFILSTELNIFPNTFFVYSVIALWGIVNLEFCKKNDTAIIAFLFLCMTSYVRIWQYNQRMLLDTSLLLMAILPYVNNKKILIDVKVVNLFAIVFFLFSIYPQLKFLSISSIANFMIQSNLETESSMLSFILPFFALYWFINKKWSLFIINVIFTIIAGKRISVLGLFITSILSITIKLYPLEFLKLKKIIPFIALFINIFYLLISYALVSGYLGDLIYELTGMSSNAFTMGRTSLYSEVFKEFDVYNSYDLLFGESKIYEILETKRIHNDVFVILMENGMIVFCVFWLLLYYKCNIISFPFIVLLNILFMTDNTLVYVPVIFCACFFIRLANQYNQYLNYKFLKYYTP